MASYPTSIKSFTTKNTGDTIQAGFFNDPQDEITAIETQLLTSGSYTPSWTNTGTANTLGNGTIAGSYIQVGKFVFAQITLTFGGTTASGDGSWLFSLPVTGASAWVGPVGNGKAFDTSVPATYGAQMIGVSATTVSPITLAAPAVAFTNGSPFTWANGDAFQVAICYLAA